MGRLVGLIREKTKKPRGSEISSKTSPDSVINWIAKLMTFPRVKPITYQLDTGEPDARKRARPVRRGGVGTVLTVEVLNEIKRLGNQIDHKRCCCQPDAHNDNRRNPVRRAIGRQLGSLSALVHHGFWDELDCKGQTCWN
jgi:hypothetical protein